MENTLKLAYPVSRLKVVVASDCLSDRTDEIVKSYGDRGIQLVRASVRKGKEAAQKLAVEVAKREILVFSDVATILTEKAVSDIVRNFSDPTVGCVSSIDRFMDKDGKLSGEGAYVRYEMWLRSLESQVHSLVGLSGSFFAARRAVCQAWGADLQSDFKTLINSTKLGLLGVIDPLSIGYYQNISDERKEFERKVRTVVRGIAILMRSWYLLNPFKFGLFAWELFSHKLCRWLVPFALCMAFVSNVLLVARSEWYVATLVLQATMYLISLVWLFSDDAVRSNPFFKIPSFFVLANVSIMIACVRYLRGERITLWNPSSR